MTQETTVRAADGTDVDVYIARPEGSARGGLIVIHEIWGLTAHIRDVADRFAAEGWLVAAPDILTRAGVTPTAGDELFALMNDPDEAVRVAAQPRMRDALSSTADPAYGQWAIGALRATVDWLTAQLAAGAGAKASAGTDDAAPARLGVVGFCFGGTFAFALAAADDRIRAAVPFYGAAPDAAGIARTRASILALYGGHDPRLIDALPGVRAAFEASDAPFTPIVYPDASHAFFNDTGSRYDADAAADAWSRATAFLAATV